MAYLSLARAQQGAQNITHNRLGGALRLCTQLGRCFIMHGRQQLAVGNDWDEALRNLLAGEVVKFVNTHKLAIPKETAFVEIADLYLSSPDALKEQFKPITKESDAPTNL